jgi:Fe-S cluster assembly ATP-binding protein
MNGLEIKNLRVNIGHGESAKEVVKGLSLSIPAGEVHAIMGPNGTGKSTLAKALAGHEEYPIVGGEAFVNGQKINDMEIEDRSKAGLFVAFQYPVEIAGVSIANFIRAALTSRMEDKTKFVATDYYKELYAAMETLKMDKTFTGRSVNDGFSGGEKKRCEILQMMMLKPSVAILDETDSGLDIDALRIVAQGVNAMRGQGRAILVITHYQRLLDYIVPDKVHVMSGGTIVKSGGKELALELEKRGYDWLTNPSLNTSVAK